MTGAAALRGRAGRAARPVVIELVGAPGSGKSTMVAAVLAGCRDAGHSGATTVDLARGLASRSTVGRMVARLPDGRVRDRLLWEVFELTSARAAVREAGRRWPLVSQVARSQLRRPAGADARQRRVLHWYRRLLGSYGSFLARGLPHEVLVLDEGFAHRAVQLFTSAVESPDAAAVERYLGAVPVPDLLVVVQAPVERCVERVLTRGVWGRFAGRDRGELERFIANAHRASSLTARFARSHGWPVLEADNADDRPDAALHVRRAVAAHLREQRAAGALAPVAGHTSTIAASVPRARSPSTFALPGPRRVARSLAARRGPPPFEPELLRDVLEAYDTEPMASSHRPLIGWRNELVVARTPDGPVVVKRYPERVTLDGIRHEHSIVEHLMAAGVPVAPLRVNRRRSTWTPCGDRYFAVADYVPGASFAGCYLTSTTAARLLRDAGTVLADFHDELLSFQPAGAHHLSTASLAADGGWDGGAERYLAVLDGFGDRPMAGMVDDERWLLDRRREIADAIVDLDRRLRHRQPTVGVIHGDFGLHNLTFGRDGDITVHDLELARRDLLLIDVAVVLSRSTVRSGRAFLDGYATRRPFAAVEWAVLPDVWEHYRWCGAVRSWANYRERGGPRRLATARRRVDEAMRVATHGVGAWA